MEVSKVRKDLPGGVWNCSAITLWVKGVFWVLQFWETTSISGRKKKRLLRFIGEEKLPGRQHELYNEKQTKVHLNSWEKLSLTWGPLHSCWSNLLKEPHRWFVYEKTIFSFYHFYLNPFQYFCDWKTNRTIPHRFWLSSFAITLCNTWSRNGTWSSWRL